VRCLDGALDSEALDAIDVELEVGQHTRRPASMSSMS
jgi:hypothetical protein